jgi:hypothetical protein
VRSLDHSGVHSLQRLAGNAGVTAALQRDDDEGGGSARSPVLDVVGKGGGASLDRGTKSFFESSYGHDFSDVRVHSDGPAQQSAAAVQAHAYTVGNEIVLGNGVDPGSDTGKRTLAHELTHVIQQREGPVDGTSNGEGVQVSDPSDRFEQAAESNADAVMSGQAPAVARADGGGSGGGATAQRSETDEVESQELHIQRSEGDEVESQELHIQRSEGDEVESQELHIQRSEGDEVESQEMHIQRSEGDEVESQELHIQRSEGDEAESQEMHIQRAALPAGEEESDITS